MKNSFYLFLTISSNTIMTVKDSTYFNTIIII